MKKIILTAFLICTIVLAKAQKSTASKNVSQFSIHSPELNTSKKIWLYLLENYKNSKTKYPVIYMHDAQNLFDAKTSYVGEWNIDEKLDSLHAKVIVVGIEHGGDKRTEELTPYSNEKYGGGKGENYTDFIVKTLKPYIDKNYKTEPDVNHTTIMGSSLGGLISMYAVLKYPTVFDKAGIFSPSFWYSDKIYDLAASSSPLKTKIYFLCGDNESEEMVIDLQKMKTTLLENEVISKQNLEVRIIENGEHNEKLWRNGFVGAYLWLNQ